MVWFYYNYWGWVIFDVIIIFEIRFLVGEVIGEESFLGVESFGVLYLYVVCYVYYKRYENF